MLLRVIIEALQKRRRKRQSGKRSSHTIQEGTNIESSNTGDVPLAYSLARIWAWPALQFRCESHPHEVSALFVDKMGETILHWTCLGKPPIEVVQAILGVCPDLARIGTRVGNLPLHGTKHREHCLHCVSGIFVAARLTFLVDASSILSPSWQLQSAIDLLLK